MLGVSTLRRATMAAGILAVVSGPGVAADEGASAHVPSLPTLQTLTWPALLNGPAVHPTLRQVQLLLAEGQVEPARAVAVGHVRDTRGAPVADQLDARLALATVLAQTDDVRTAEELFRTVAERAVETQGFMAPHLLPARAGEGLIAAHRGDVVAAQAALAEALHLHRVQHGLYDPEQTRYLRTLAELADSSGAVEDATLLFKRSIHVLHRQLDDYRGEADAQWYQALGGLLERLRSSPALSGLALALGRLTERLEAQPGDHGDVLTDLRILHTAADLHFSRESRREIPWNPRRLRSLQGELMSHPPPRTARQSHQLIEVGHIWWLAGDGRRAMRSFEAAAASGDATVALRLSRAEALIWPFDAPRPMTDAEAEGSVQVVFSIDGSGRLTRIREVTVFPADDPIGQARATALRRALGRAVFRPSLVQDRRLSSSRSITLQDRYRPSS